MRLSALLSLAVLCPFLHAPVCFAHPETACSQGRKKERRHLAKSTLATPEEADYDVKHVQFDLNMTNASTAVSGKVRTTAVALVPAMGIYAFELDTALTIDSVKVNGAALPVVTSGKNIRKVALPQPPAQGQAFQAEIWYHGQPPGGTGFFTHGLNHFTLTPGPIDITYTLGDMYYASEWWPCKQDIRDKIDSVDMALTVPAGTMGCSNGLLHSSTTLPDGRRHFAWQHRYPIKYYLITAAIAPYQLLADTARFADGTTLPIHNYLYSSGRMTPGALAGLDSLAPAIRFYSDCFGKYPFASEKYGNCQAPLPGGMEHQTMTTLGEQVDFSVVVHELAHQWWGDCVSQKTWQDIWLSEGFATYCEELFLERSLTPAAMVAYRTALHNRVRRQAGGAVYVSDTTDENRVFDNRLTYAKGSVVAGMLRHRAPVDSLFFVACRQYQQTYRYGHATTDDLKNVFETVYGADLDTFFQQWVYGQGFPNFRVSWHYQNGTAYVKLVQTTSFPASVALFHTPVDLELNTPNGPVVHQVYVNQATQVFALPSADTVTGIRLDPGERLLNGQVGAITRDPTLHIRPTGSLPFFRLSPNPATEFWLLEDLEAGVAMQLLDAEGRVCWQGISGKGPNRIAARELAPGMYLLRLEGQFAARLLKP